MPHAHVSIHNLENIRIRTTEAQSLLGAQASKNTINIIKTITVLDTLYKNKKKK